MGIFDWFKNKKEEDPLLQRWNEIQQQRKLKKSKCPQPLIDSNYNIEYLLKILKRRKEVEIGESSFDSRKDLEETLWFTEILKNNGFDPNFLKDSVVEKKLMTLFFQFDPMYIDETIKELSVGHKFWKETIYKLHNDLESSEIKLEKFTEDYPTMDDLLTKTYHTTT